MNTIQLWRPVRLEAFGGLVTKSCPTLVTPWAVAVHGKNTRVGSHFPCKNTRVGSHFLLQGIFPTQGLNPGLLHCRLILYRLSYQGPPHTNNCPLGTCPRPCEACRLEEQGGLPLNWLISRKRRVEGATTHAISLSWLHQSEQPLPLHWEECYSTGCSCP